MECEQVQNRLVEYVDAELPDGEQSRVEDHVADCAACRVRLRRVQDGHRATKETLSRLAPPDTYLTDARLHALLQAYSRRSAPPRLISLRGFVAAAAIAVILTSVYVLIPDLIGFFNPPSPSQVADRNSFRTPALTPLVVTSAGEGARPHFFPVRVHKSLEVAAPPPDRRTTLRAADDFIRTHPEWITVPAENVYYDESEAAHWW